jgi:hypothetical protein
MVWFEQFTRHILFQRELKSLETDYAIQKLKMNQISVSHSDNNLMPVCGGGL